MQNYKYLVQLLYSYGNLDFSKYLNNSTCVEYIVLSKIDEYTEENNVDYINVTKLSEKLNVSTPAVSRVLKSLESKKYIVRNIDIFCRRNTHVKLTEAGIKELKKCHDNLDEFFSSIFIDINEEEQKTIINSFETIYKKNNNEIT